MIAASSHKTNNNLKRFSHLIAYSVLAITTTLLLWPLFTGRSLYWGDIFLYFDPMYRFQQVSINHGMIPLWNPYIFNGQPFLGNPQMSIFYPSSLLFVLFSVPTALSIITIAHLFLCGAFSYHFLKRWTPRSTAALAGALVFMGSSCIVGRIQFPPMLQTVIYFPLILLSIDRCIDRFSLLRWLILATVLGLSILAAHPQFAYIIFSCATIYCISRLWRKVGCRTFSQYGVSHSEHLLGISELESADNHLLARLITTLRAITPFVFAMLFGILIASVQLIPALQLLHESSREKMTFTQSNRFYMDFPHLLTLIIPRYVGHPVSGDYWARGNAWEPAIFIGWVPLILIGLAAAKRWRRPSVQLWIVMAIIGLWLSLGANGGLYFIAFWTVPGISSFHDPARFLLVTTFAFAVLSAFGMTILINKFRENQRIISAVLIIGIILPLWFYGKDWNPTISEAILNTQYPTPNAKLPDRRLTLNTEHQTPSTRYFQTGNNLYWERFVNYSDYRADDKALIQKTYESQLSNVSMRSGIETSFGYEPVPLSASASLDDLLRVAQRRNEPYLAHLIGITNSNYLMSSLTERPPTPQFIHLKQTPFPGQRAVSVNTKSMPRAWLVRNIYRVDGRMRISAALAAPDFNPSLTAIVSGEVSVRPNGLEWGDGVTRTKSCKPVEMISVQTHRIEMRTDAGASPALLVYSMSAYPGWKAEVDGSETALIRTNGAFMGLLLLPGIHRVILKYEPDTYYVGAYLSLLALGCMAAISGLLLLNRFKSSR